MRIRVTPAILLALFTCAIPSRAAGETITFESDPLGLTPSGFQSRESNLVRFTGSETGNLVILTNFANELRGTRGLVAFGSATNLVILDFAVPVSGLSLFFGNDDPSATVPGQTAILRAFADGTLVGESSVLMNRNDIMDQSISFAMAGVLFTRATFNFSAGPAAPARTVDDISFTPVPEPASVALVGAGLLLAAHRRRRAARAREAQ